MSQLVFTVSTYSRYRHIVVTGRIRKEDLLCRRIHCSDNIHIAAALCAYRSIYINTADVYIEAFIRYIYFRRLSQNRSICVVIIFNTVLGNDLYLALEILVNLIQDPAVSFIIDNCLDTAIQKGSCLLI